MVKNIWMSHIGRCTELGYLSVGHISSNYHQHSKCTVLFVKHRYFHLSSFKKLLSSCWLIQVYIQCKTISSCRHFRHQQNRNWNSVHHCIKTWQKMQKLIICNSDSLILQCFQDIFIIYQFQIILWNGPECLKNGLKKHMFRVCQNARLNSLKIHKNYCTLRMSLILDLCLVETAYLNDYYLKRKGKSSIESKDLSAACEYFNSRNEFNRKLKKSQVFTFKRT